MPLSGNARCLRPVRMQWLRATSGGVERSAMNDGAKDMIGNDLWITLRQPLRQRAVSPCVSPLNIRMPRIAHHLPMADCVSLTRGLHLSVHLLDRPTHT